MSERVDRDLEGTTNDLVGLVYDAVGDLDAWRRFLDELGRATGAMSVLLLFQDLDRSDGQIVVQSGSDAWWLGRYNEYYGSVNPWFATHQGVIQPGRVLESHQELPNEILAKTEFFADYLVPQDILYSVNAVLFRDASRTGNMTLQRSAHQGPLSEASLELLARLIPHVQRALSLHGRILGLEAARDGLGAGLERLAQAVCLVDRRGRVTFASRRADAILASCDGLTRTRDGRLRATRQEDRERFDAALDAAVAPIGTAAAVGTTLAVSRSPRKAPLAVTVTPLSVPLAPLANGPAALVVLDDPEARIETSERAVQRLHGLTPAEARLATRLARGHRLQDVADDLGVSIHTARTQLKQVFAKTGVRRQAELVSLLLRGRTPNGR